MKQMLLAVLSALCFHASAQITITASTFPAVNDTFRFATDNAPAAALNSVLTPPGGNQTWDLSAAQTDQTSETIYKPAVAGQNVISFPGSELVVIGPQSETYFNITNNKVEVLGYSGGDPAGLGINVLAKYGPPIIERRSPLSFFDINQQTTNLNLPFSTAQLPDSLLQGLPVVPDSIRIRINTQRLEVMDGWGTLKIPSGQQYPVLRQKRTEYTTTGIDVYVGFLGWIDLSTLLGGGGGLGGALGTDTTVTFRFYNNVVKQEIAILTLNNDQSGLESVRFKNETTTAAPDLNAPGSAGIQAFPNPAVEWVRFDCSNLPPDDYTLKIFNIVGKVVWKETYPLAGNKSIRLELNDFKKGTYLYSLVDKRGNVIGTKRLVVVKP